MSLQTINKGKLRGIVDWVKTEGEVKGIDRLRLKVLPELLAEGIHFGQIDAETACSYETLSLVRDAAQAVVGKPCTQ